MLRGLVLLALVGAVFGHALDNLVTIGDFQVSFHSVRDIDGTTDIRWIMGPNSTQLTASQYFAIGLQNGNAFDANDVSMYGPVGEGTEFFFMYGTPSSATGLHRYLNNTLRPASGNQRNGRPPVPIQRMTAPSAASPGMSDRIRNVTISTFNGTTTYKMSLSCETNYWTNFSAPLTVLWSMGVVDGSGEPSYHGANRGWKRVSSNDDLLQFIMCGPGRGPVNAPTTATSTGSSVSSGGSGTTPAVTTTSKAPAMSPFSVLSALCLAMACFLIYGFNLHSLMAM